MLTSFEILYDAEIHRWALTQLLTSNTAGWESRTSSAIFSNRGARAKMLIPRSSLAISEAFGSFGFSTENCWFMGTPITIGTMPSGR